MANNEYISSTTADDMVTLTSYTGRQIDRLLDILDISIYILCKVIAIIDRLIQTIRFMDRYFSYSDKYI